MYTGKTWSVHYFPLKVNAFSLILSIGDRGIIKNAQVQELQQVGFTTDKGFFPRIDLEKNKSLAPPIK
jgi:hypothetical protein